jgi:hypothetical protein
MFSQSLEKYWRSTGEILEKYWTYTSGTPLLPPYYYSLAIKDSEGIPKEEQRTSKEEVPEPTFADSSTLHVQTPGYNTCRLLEAAKNRTRILFDSNTAFLL